MDAFEKYRKIEVKLPLPIINLPQTASKLLMINVIHEVITKHNSCILHDNKSYIDHRWSGCVISSFLTDDKVSGLVPLRSTLDKCHLL